ncbi:MAG TPA: AAA family ATPase [Nocardioides sp.]
MVGAPVIERDTEITVLGGLLSRAVAGRGSLVTIEGQAGIGKTRLLSHIRRRASSAGWRILDSRCTPQSGSIEFGLFRDWFGTLAHRAGADGNTFTGPGRVLVALGSGSGSGPGEGAQHSVGDVAYGARWALEDLTADQPTLLLADDVQWADRQSLQALDLLANPLRQLPCLVVWTVRSGEPIRAADDLGRLITSSTVVTPRAWTRRAVAGRVAAAYPRSGEVERRRLTDEVYAASGGVPFYVESLLADPDPSIELSDGHTRQVSDAVAGSVADRLGRLGSTAVATATATCVLEGWATVSTIAVLINQPSDVVAEDVSALVAARILAHQRNGIVRPAYPIVADVLLSRMSVTEESKLHHAAAAVLIKRGAPRAEIAEHLLLTLPGNDPEVRARLREAGDLALRSGSADTALKYLDRALAEGPIDVDQIGLLASAARAESLQGELDAALLNWERAWELAGDDETRSRLRAEAGDALVLAGRHQDAEGVYGAPDDSETVGGRLLARMVLAGLLNGVNPDYIHKQVDAILADPPSGDNHGDRLRLSAAAVLLTFECRDGKLARDLAIRAVDGGALLLDETAEGSALYLTSGVLGWCSAFAEAEALLTSAMDEARSRNSVMALASAAACRGGVRMRMGMVTEALADLEVALAQRSQGWSAYLAGVLASLVEGRIARGELDRAASYRDDLEELSHVPGMTAAQATYALADLAAVHADHDRAAGLYARVGQLVEGRMDNPAIMPWRAGEALARIRLGEPRLAVELAQANMERARAFGAPYAVAQALRTLAAVDATADRVGLLREALAVLRRVPAPRLEAQVATDLAGMLLLTHGMTDTIEPVALLRQAESYAAFQELRPLSDRVHRLLERIGEPVKRSTTESLSSLTVSERRVAELAASGLSNRQIAQHLFVTIKAVEWHLSNVYRKLGIRSRTRLPALLNVPVPRSPAAYEKARLGSS